MALAVPFHPSLHKPARRMGASVAFLRGVVAVQVFPCIRNMPAGPQDALYETPAHIRGGLTGFWFGEEV